MHRRHTGARSLLRGSVMLTGSHLVVVVPLIRHGTMLHRIAMLALRSTRVLSLGEITLHCRFISPRSSAKMLLCTRLTLSWMLLHHHGSSGRHLHVHLSRVSLLGTLMTHWVSTSESGTGLRSRMAWEVRLHMTRNG